jgi:adenylate cyclase
MNNLLIIGLYFAFGLLNSLAQTPEGGKIEYNLAWADSLSQNLNSQWIEDDYSHIISNLNKAIAIYAEHGDTCKMGWLMGHLCNTYDVSGKLDSALLAGINGVNLFRPHCDSLYLMSSTVYLTNVYISLGEYEKTLAICNEALQLWNPKWRFALSKDGLLTNSAIALALLGRNEEALEAFRDVLRNAIAEKDNRLIREAYMNLGGMFGMLSESEGTNQLLLDSAETYSLLGLGLIRDEDPIGVNMMTQYSNIAAIKIDRGQHRQALLYNDSAKVIANRLGDLPVQINLTRMRGIIYNHLGDYKLALDEAYSLMDLKDSLMGVEKMKAVTELQEKYESEKKVGEINKLKIQNLDSQLKEERATRIRNIISIVGIMLLLLAAALWSRLSYTKRAKIVIENEKKRSEELLLNILPAEVAEELKANGSAEAVQIDQVTVLFTDFKGFTALSEKVTPKELVHDLHACFSEFDRICEKYAIEKIKTIGDAYMAAGGLPSPNTTHPQDVARAALEMAEVVEQGKAKKIQQGLPFFEIRIGIHTGPVVAGIVGLKKFQYDIWGDTVNTASRMESSGEVGKVNISEATYDLLKNEPNFAFESRGKIEAKGKGEIEMYFVSVNNE